MSATKRPSLPDRSTRTRPHDTEIALIAAATELFADQGYNGTTIVDLAEQLGLTTASLYYHVRSKQELLMRVLDTSMSDFQMRLETIVKAQVGPRDKLRLAVENHLTWVLTYQKAVVVFLRERRHLENKYRSRYQVRVDRYDQLFTSIVQEAMDAGDIPAGDATLQRLAILGMINSIVEWFRPEGRFTATQIVQYWSDLVFDRLLAK